MHDFLYCYVKIWDHQWIQRHLDVKTKKPAEAGFSLSKLSSDHAPLFRPYADHFFNKGNYLKSKFRHHLQNYWTRIPLIPHC